MTPTKAERIMEIKPSATYSPVPAGHCPQDDNPMDSNIALSSVGGNGREEKYILF